MNSKWPETSKRCLVLPQFPIGSPQFVWGGKAFVVGLDWFQTGGGPTSKCWPEGNTPPADATTPTDSPAHTTQHLYRLIFAPSSSATASVLDRKTLSFPGVVKDGGGTNSELTCSGFMFSLFNRVSCFPVKGFMFSLVGFHVFPFHWCLSAPASTREPSNHGPRLRTVTRTYRRSTLFASPWLLWNPSA
jgi:hypothetical protein